MEISSILLHHIHKVGLEESSSRYRCCYWFYHFALEVLLRVSVNTLAEITYYTTVSVLVVAGEVTVAVTMRTILTATQTAAAAVAMMNDNGHHSQQRRTTL